MCLSSRWLELHSFLRWALYLLIYLCWRLLQAAANKQLGPMRLSEIESEIQHDLLRREEHHVWRAETWPGHRLTATAQQAAWRTLPKPWHNHWSVSIQTSGPPSFLCIWDYSESGLRGFIFNISHVNNSAFHLHVPFFVFSEQFFCDFTQCISAAQNKSSPSVYRSPFLSLFLFLTSDSGT